MDPVVEQMDVFFNPKSVAVVGASRKIMKAGHVIFKNFAANKRRGIFKGELYPVNPSEDYVLGHKSYPSLTKIIGDVELVVIVVPADIVPKIMREAADAGVKAAAIISSGFGEIGKEELEEEVKTIARNAGIRILGPNCLGVYDSKTGVDMLFLPETKVLSTGDEMVVTPRPMSGPISIVTQSGAFGVSALDYLTGRQLGVSKFVSFGNKSDVNESEMLRYMLQDEATRVILLYAESIDAGREFIDVAEEVTKKKPIVALKLGKTKAGARAAKSHTGAIAGSDRIYDSVFKHVGVVRVKDMEEFFDVGKAFAFQPPAAGKNVAIITDAGGPGVMAVDESASRGLIIQPFSKKTLRKFKELKREDRIPAFATNLNPVDLTGSATSEMFKLSVEIAFEDPAIDGVILLGMHHTPGLQEDFVDKVAEVAKNYTKPIVACDIGETEMALFIRSRYDKLGIPSFTSPEDASRAMAALVEYGLYLKKTGCFEQYVNSFQQS